MFRIENIKLSNYKNIDSAQIDFGNLNVIVGPNNSGKSNFLQSICFINEFINGKMDSMEQGFAGNYKNYGYIFPKNFDMVPKKNKNETFDFELKYSDDTNSYRYIIKLGLKVIIEKEGSTLFVKEEELEYKNKKKTGPLRKIFHRSDNDITYGDDLRKTSIISKAPDYASSLRVLKIIADVDNSDTNYNSAIKGLFEILDTPVFYFSNHRFNKNNDAIRVIDFNLKEEILKIREGNLWNSFKKVLSNILQISDIKIIDLNKGIIKENEYNLDSKKNITNKLTLNFLLFFKQFDDLKRLDDLSDGTVLLIALVVKVFRSTKSLLIIEELENSIHPKALQDLIYFFKSFGDEKQFVITTHSSSLLNMIAPEEVVISKVSNNGRSELSKIKNIKELKRKINEGFISFGDTLFYDIDNDLENES